VTLEKIGKELFYPDRNYSTLLPACVGERIIASRIDEVATMVGKTIA